ncbi:MAG: hypothetical protein RL254_976 [Planctomycetota bacterium]
MGKASQQVAGMGQDMNHRWLMTLAACALTLAGCTSMAHTRVPTTLIVVDAITGKPAPNIHIQQSSQTGYISKPIMSDATTGDDGRALFDVVYARWRSSLWRLSRPNAAAADRPATRGTWSLDTQHPLPPEFEQLADDQYRIPLWPSLKLVIELPRDFVGLVIEAPTLEPSQDGRGWMPPNSIDGMANRVALVKPDANGVVAYPTCIAGFRGFGFDGDTTFYRRNADTQGFELVKVIWATEPITSLNESTGVQEPSSRDFTCVYAWSIWVANYSRVDLTSDDLWSQAPHRSRVWFVGTLADLRRWIVEHHLVTTKSHYRDFDRTEPAAVRGFDAAQLLPLIPSPAPQSTSPVWIETISGTASSSPYSP